MKETDLNIVLVSRSLFDVARTGVFNNSNGAIGIKGIILPSDDCDYHYLIHAESKRKLTKAQTAWVHAFIEGVAYARHESSKFQPNFEGAVQA